jgi:hypothetical protein
MPIPGVPVPVAPSRTPLSWTTVLIATGALLVIVAAAVFAIAAWQLVSPVLRFLFLGALTFGFYVAGERVRSKLDLSTGGVALTVVGSAMLLFDGWILIDGYQLTGPLPFAGWFLLCSVVYWLTELRLRSRFFGITGAAAQIAWWWLLGEGLGWAVEPRLAAISVVLAIWAIVARGVDEDSPFASLAGMLRLAAPIGAVAIVWAFMAQFGGGDATAFVSATLVGISVSVIVDALDLPGVSGAFGYLPLMLLAGGHVPSEWWQVVLFGGLGVTHIGIELRRGRGAYGVLGLLWTAIALFALGGALDLSDRMLVALFIALALVWSGIAFSMRRMKIAEEYRAERVRVMALTFEFGGWTLLAGASIATLFVTRAFPVVGLAATLSDAVLVLFAAAAILGASVLHRRPAVVGAMIVSLYGLWILLDVAAPALRAPLRAIWLIVATGAWYLAANVLERVTGAERALTRMAARLSVALLFMTAVLLDAWYVGLPTWQSAALLGALAMWFLADGLLDRTAVYFGVAGAAAVAAIAMWGGWHADGGFAAMVGSLAALGIAAVGLLVRRVRGLAVWAPWAAVAVAVVVAPVAWSDAGALAFGLAACAAAASVAAFSSGWIEGVLIAGVLAASAMLAALANANVTAWSTTGAMIALAAVMLLPSFVLDTDEKSVVGRTVRALCAAGAISIVMLVAVGIGARDLWYDVPAWMALDRNALAVSVATLGAYVLGASVAHDLENGLFVGVFFLLSAYWLKLGDLDRPPIEYFTVPASVYVAWCGYRWARLHPSRPFPVLCDVGAAALLLMPSAYALNAIGISAALAWQHTLWGIGLAIAGIALGVVLRVRVYFLGSVFALIYIAFVRTWTYLVEYWWVVLGVVGIGMIIVALARELRRQMVTGVRDVLEGWR